MRFRHPLVVVLAFAPLAAHGEDEWIDEFPSVTTVAHAAAEELKITYASSPNLDVTDDDTVAVNLTGTFVVLREILALKHVEGPRLSAAGEDKFRRLVAAYQEAELTIGQGGPERHGYIRSATGGIRCGDDDACYQRWFLQHLHSNTSRAEYRERFLKRLFPCGDLARELNDLRQAHTVGMQYYPSPATTFVIESEVAGIGPAGCSAYGGDTDRDGLCNDWQRVSTRTRGASANACPIRLTGVQNASGGGLKVSIARDSLDAFANGAALTSIALDFRVVRAASPVTDDNATVLLDDSATIQVDAANPASPYVLIARTLGAIGKLVPDEGRPFLLVDVTSAPSRGPVHCEQPLRTWLDRHKTSPNGLHGPYESALEALFEDFSGYIAWQMAVSVKPTPWYQYPDYAEFGFAILQKKAAGASAGGYYTTPPRRSAGGALRPRFSSEDYLASIEAAFVGSCEDVAQFVPMPATTVHTHPGTSGSPQNFSVLDFNGAVASLARVPMQMIALIDPRDPCIRIFEPKSGDEEINWLVETIDEFGGGLFTPGALYQQYTDRVAILTRCFP